MLASDQADLTLVALVRASSIVERELLAVVGEIADDPTEDRSGELRELWAEWLCLQNRILDLVVCDE